MARLVRGLIAGASAALFVAACAPQPRVPAPPEPVAKTAALPPGYAVARVPLSLQRYKALVAQEIWLRSPDVYTDPIPEMLKSIVVLEITIDRAGNPIDVFVYRSNGYRHLESRALESIVRAAPFPAPPPSMLSGAGEVTFLETFLFRDDEHFQLRTLVRAADD